MTGFSRPAKSTTPVLVGEQPGTDHGYVIRFLLEKSLRETSFVSRYLVMATYQKNTSHSAGDVAWIRRPVRILAKPIASSRWVTWPIVLWWPYYRYPPLLPNTLHPFLFPLSLTTSVRRWQFHRFAKTTLSAGKNSDNFMNMDHQLFK